MKTKMQISQEALMEQLEYDLNNLYGSEFIEDLQELCGLTTMRAVFGKGATTQSKQSEYVAMLRGAWYAARQSKLVTK